MPSEFSTSMIIYFAHIKILGETHLAASHLIESELTRLTMLQDSAPRLH